MPQLSFLQDFPANPKVGEIETWKLSKSRGQTKRGVEVPMVIPS